MERTKEKFKIFIFKSGEKLQNFCSQNDAMLLNYVFQKIIKVSIIHYDINPLYSVSRPCYTWQSELKQTKNKLQPMQDIEMILLLENNNRGGMSSLMGDRFVKSD